MSNNENADKNIPGVGMKMEILHFKNEVLSDIKKTEKLIADRYAKMNESLEEKF